MLQTRRNANYVLRNGSYSVCAGNTSFCLFGPHLRDVLVDAACPADVLFAPAVDRRHRPRPPLLNQRRGPHRSFGCCLAPTLSRMFRCPYKGLAWWSRTCTSTSGSRSSEYCCYYCLVERTWMCMMRFTKHSALHTAYCIQRTAKLPGAKL